MKHSSAKTLETNIVGPSCATTTDIKSHRARAHQVAHKDFFVVAPQGLAPGQVEAAVRDPSACHRDDPLRRVRQHPRTPGHLLHTDQHGASQKRWRLFGAVRCYSKGCAIEQTRQELYSSTALLCSFPAPPGRCFRPSPGTPSVPSCPGCSCSRRVLVSRRKHPSAWRERPGRAGSGHLHPRGRPPKLAGKWSVLAGKQPTATLEYPSRAHASLSGDKVWNRIGKP